MKQLFKLTAMVAILLSFNGCKTASNTLSTDNNSNSLSWVGWYEGMTPCADCQGIQTLIKLTQNGAYEMKTLYAGQGKDATTETGTVKWNGNGTVITLVGNGQSAGNSYLISADKITMLDRNNKTITGNMSDRYVLKKAHAGIADRHWTLTELNGKSVKTAPKEVWLILNFEDNSVTGNSGCNTFRGIYELSWGDRIKFTKMVSTMMACLDMETERTFLDAINKVDSYTINGDILTLNRARMAPLARFKAE